MVEIYNWRIVEQARSQFLVLVLSEEFVVLADALNHDVTGADLQTHVDESAIRRTEERALRQGAQ